MERCIINDDNQMPLSYLHWPANRKLFVDRIGLMEDTSVVQMVAT